MCLAPRQAFLHTKTVPTEYSEFWSFSPFDTVVKDYGGEYRRFISFTPPRSDSERIKRLVLPCRKCVECVQAYSNTWALRCMLESQEYSRSCFITLTFDDDHVPDKVKPRDLQLFFKRLRKYFGVKSLRYFATGEYGLKSGRPHYHVILFGVDFSDDRIFLKQDNRGNAIYISPTLSKLWKFGFHSIGALTFESCRYCAKYMQKFNLNEKRKSFTIQSRKPAIGYNYCMSHAEQIAKTGCVYVNGREFRAPWQFKKWLKSNLKTAFLGASMDDLRIMPDNSFTFIYNQAWERRDKVRKKFGFWNIKGLLKKITEKGDDKLCTNQENELPNPFQLSVRDMFLMKKRAS